METGDKSIPLIFMRFLSLRIFVHEARNEVKKISVSIESLNDMNDYLYGLNNSMLFFDGRKIKLILIFMNLKSNNFINICSFEKLLFDKSSKIFA